jgi:hypothetical protein
LARAGAKFAHETGVLLQQLGDAFGGLATLGQTGALFNGQCQPIAGLQSELRLAM